MFSELIKLLAENITGKLKSDNPMLWVQKMNNIRNQAINLRFKNERNYNKID